MKFPNHILLDVKNNNLLNSTQYWTFKYLFFLNANFFYFNTLTFNQKFLNNKFKFKSFFLNHQNQFTLIYKITDSFILFNPYKKIMKSSLEFKKISKVKHLFNPYFTLKNNVFSNKSLIKKTNSLWNLFDINFLRKEKMYTKLKYSRVPQYDIVSGGAAVLFSGFLGFLICEKFGFELIDSGDFYILFMYIGFLVFALRPFLKITSKENLSWNALSYKWFLLFYRNALILIFNKIKN